MLCMGWSPDSKSVCSKGLLLVWHFCTLPSFHTSFLHRKFQSLPISAFALSHFLILPRILSNCRGCRWRSCSKLLYNDISDAPATSALRRRAHLQLNGSQNVSDSMSYRQTWPNHDSLWCMMVDSKIFCHRKRSYLYFCRFISLVPESK